VNNNFLSLLVRLDEGIEPKIYQQRGGMPVLQLENISWWGKVFKGGKRAFDGGGGAKNILNIL